VGYACRYGLRQALTGPPQALWRRDGPSTWGIVLNWRASELTIRCVQALRGEPIDRILIVDNGSGPADWQILTKYFEGVEGIALTNTRENLGYAGGMQWGIRIALEKGADFVWLVNNDCTQLEGSLAPLLEEMKLHPETAACCGITEHPTRAPLRFTAGGRLDKVLGEHVHLCSSELFRRPRYLVDYVGGHAWLLRASAIKRVGGLDCRLFLYGEEPDWCYRARMEDMHAVVVPRSRIKAEWSATGRRFPCQSGYYGARNKVWLVRRQGAIWQRILHHTLLLGFRLPKAILGFVARRETECLSLFLLGIWHGLTRPVHWSDEPAAAASNRLPSLR
jgi:GT2 family glycosyltransferase